MKPSKLCHLSTVLTLVILDIASNYIRQVIGFNDYHRDTPNPSGLDAHRSTYTHHLAQTLTFTENKDLLHLGL